MTQSELWLAKWQEAVDFLETNHRKPSKFVLEERNMRSWWKHNKKLMNAGELKPERVEMFERLLELGEKTEDDMMDTLWDKVVTVNL